MREIKFRAWHPKGAEASGRFGYAYTYWKLGSGLDNSVFFHQATAVEQFTGLLDKNGKEIYEGDILSMKSDKPAPGGGWIAGTREYHFFHSVSFDEGRFLFDGLRVLRDELNFEKRYGGYEVVGNIHENPELTEEKKP